MKKSIIMLAMIVALSAGMIVYGWIFLDGQTGKAVLTEETVSGNRSAADGLKVGFRADSANDLHWTNSFDYSKNKTKSSFKMGKILTKNDMSVYDDFRFTGWYASPYIMRLQYGQLKGLQDNRIQKFYDKIQQRVMKNGGKQAGIIRLASYVNYYPISFRFQFGTKLYDSDNVLTALKIYENGDEPYAGKAAAYDADIDLYVALNNIFKIPVIKNEYQSYTVSKLNKYDSEKSLGYKTTIVRSNDAGKDYYEFDPIIVLQEENIRDGTKWNHPDISIKSGADTDGNAGAEVNEPDDSKTASEYGLKNRMLFVVNNRTAKGRSVDVSNIKGGYGIYELPIDVLATRTVVNSRRDQWLENPEPRAEDIKLVYPLDEKAEYVEMSMSRDHRYIALFSVKDGDYFVEMVDADKWTSDGPVKVFPASDKMSYAWGDDGSLAVTNHEGDIAVFAKTENKDASYGLLYCGSVDGDLDEVLFSQEMAAKKNSYAKYRYGIDTGLAISVKDGKAALVQNLPVGDPKDNVRNAALECIIVDKSGVLYRGILKNNIVDIDYDITDGEINKMDFEALKGVIKPAGNENWSRWDSEVSVK